MPGGPVAPTAALERGRTVYVLSSCHFCHGIDLTGASMGAADLMHSPLVGADRNGNLIGSIVLAGLPNLQTAMPKFADLTKDQISDLAGYVHYLRQQGRYKELMAAKLPAGDARAGEIYFNGSAGCSKCHSTIDLAISVRKYGATTLRSRFLRPGPVVPVENVTRAPVNRRTFVYSEFFPRRRGKRSRLSRTPSLDFFALAGGTANSPDRDSYFCSGMVMDSRSCGSLASHQSSKA